MRLDSKKKKDKPIENSKYIGYGNFKKDIQYSAEDDDELAITGGTDAIDGEMSVRYLEKQFYKVISNNSAEEKIKLWYFPIFTAALCIAYTIYVWVVRPNDDENMTGLEKIDRYLNEYIYRCLTQNIFFIITIPLRVFLQKEMDKIKKIGYLHTGRKISYILSIEDLIVFLVTCLVLFETGIISFFDPDKEQDEEEAKRIGKILEVAYIFLEVTIMIELLFTCGTSAYCLYLTITHNMKKDKKDALGELMYTGKHHYNNKNVLLNTTSNNIKSENNTLTNISGMDPRNNSKFGDDASTLDFATEIGSDNTLTSGKKSKTNKNKCTCMFGAQTSTDTILRQSDVMTILATKRDELGSELLEKQRLLTKLQDTRSHGQDSSAAISDLLMDMVGGNSMETITGGVMSAMGVETANKLIGEDSATINAKLREKKNSLTDETEVLKLKAARLSSTIKMQTSKLEGLKSDLTKRTMLVTSLRDEVAALYADVTSLEAKAQLLGITPSNNIQNTYNTDIENESNRTTENIEEHRDVYKQSIRRNKYNDIGDDLLAELNN